MNPLLLARVLVPLLVPVPALDSWTGFKSAVASCGDIDGDGTPDLAVAGRESSAPDLVLLVSGKNGSLLRGLEGAFKHADVVMRVVGIGDFDGDRLPDLAVKYRREGTRIFSCKSGLVLLELPFCDDIAPARDLDGDGLADLLYAVRGRSAVLRYGATAKREFEIRPGVHSPMRSTDFADALCWGPDVDGDGLADIVVSCVKIELKASSGQPQHGFGVALYSSKNGTGLWEHLDKADGTGSQSILRLLGDIDEDGTGDMLVGLEGRYVVGLSGRTGARIHEHKAARHVVYAFASSLDVVGDVDRDGFPDWVMGANEQAKPFFDFGFARLHSGKSGKQLLELEHSTQFGFDACGAGDVDGDAVADVALFVERESNAGPTPDCVSAVSLRSGKDGHLIWRKTLPELRSGSQPKPGK